MASTTVESIEIGGMAIRFLVESSDTLGGGAVFEFEVPTRAGITAAHSHDGYEETIYGLAGVLTWTIDGTETEIGAGEALVIPRGAVHRFANLGTETAKSLAIITPGLLGPEYFREVAAVLDAAGDGPPDPAELGAVMRRHGLTPHP